MNTISENITITDNRPPSTDLKQSPPAFLDLADSVSPLHHLPLPYSHLSVQAARRGTNLPDMSAVRLANSIRKHVSNSHPPSARGNEASGTRTPASNATQAFRGSDACARAQAGA